MSEVLNISLPAPANPDHGDQALTDSGISECRATYTVVIIHSSPLLQLGLASTILESTELSDYRVYSFTTITEANGALIEIKSGDIILLDSHSWLELNRPKNTIAMNAAKAWKVAFGLLLSVKQTELNGIQSNGALGVISLDAESADVISAIKSIAERSQQGIVKRNEASQGFETLTSKQLHLLELIAEGLSNKQISSCLGISEGTVKSHVTTLLKKLHRHRRVQLAMLFSQWFYSF